MRRTMADELADLDRALHGRASARVQEAYNVGRAAAEGWDSLPLPHDSVIETLIDGVPTRVLLVEAPRDV